MSLISVETPISFAQRRMSSSLVHYIRLPSTECVGNPMEITDVQGSSGVRLGMTR